MKMPKSSTNFQYVEIDEVLSIHKALVAQAGTNAALRDFALLHSAIERPKATFGGQDLYPTVFSKAAALLQSLCMNHPFTDGNKRTSWLTTKRFLHLNGYHLLAKRKEAGDFIVSVDTESSDLKVIVQWLKKHSEKY